MEIAKKLTFFAVDLILPLIVGYYLVRKRGVSQRFFDRLMVVLILTISPAVALLAMWRVELAVKLIWLPVLGLAMQVTPGLIGWHWSRAKAGYGPLEQSSYAISAILGNRGVMGMITMLVLFPGRTTDVVSYGMLVMLFARLTLHGVCYPIANRARQTHENSGAARTPLWRAFLHRNQVPVVGMAVGIGLNLGGASMPAALDTVTSVLLHVMLALFVMPVGAAVDFTEMKRYWRDVVDLIPIKFVVAPVVMYFVSRAVGLDGFALTIVVVFSCGPTAINAVVTARLFKLNVHVTMAAFALTTGVYLVVVLPLILLIVSRGWIPGISL